MISRGRWLGWGAFATAVALLLGCFAGWLWLERPPEQTLRSTATYRSEGQALTLDTSAGHGRVEIAAGRPGEIRVERTLAWDRARPQASQTWRDGVLSVAVGCPRTGLVSLPARCAADYRIWVPPELAVRARVGDGDLTVTGLRGALHLTVPRGDVALSEISGPTVARVGEGSLVALGVRSPTVEVHGDEGLLSLAFASVPQRVEAVLGQGSLSVDLPDEGLYRVEGGVVEGSERIDVAIREAAPSMVIARVTEGSLDIG